VQSLLLGALHRPDVRPRPRLAAGHRSLNLCLPIPRRDRSRTHPAYLTPVFLPPTTSNPSQYASYPSLLHRIHSAWTSNSGGTRRIARLAIGNNRPIFWLSKHLGHSSLDVTSNVYGHFENATRKREAEAMAGAFRV